MKRFTKLAPAAVALMAMGMMAGTLSAEISGSKHDFADKTLYPTNWSNGQICLPCHAPHNTTPSVTTGGIMGGPLWNRTLPTNSYKMYISTAVAAPTGTDPNATTNVYKATDGKKVDTNSILCLSCHDGSIALDSFGGATSTTAGVIGGKANFGTDLTNDHPIGEAAKWKEVSYMVSRSFRDSSRIMPLRNLDDGTWAVGCTSCHEPHNRTGAPNMLWVNNGTAGTTVDGRAVSGSVLCLNCHKK